MELSKQIKKYRTEANLSQEELADKIYVSRQTISNWENEKNYPDIKSLVLMSEVFQVSLDNLKKLLHLLTGRVWMKLKKQEKKAKGHIKKLSW